MAARTDALKRPAVFSLRKVRAVFAVLVVVTSLLAAISKGDG